MPETIGKRIRDTRIARGMTQEDLARAIGTTKQNIYKYENGVITNIPLENVESIARALDVTPESLTGWGAHEDDDTWAIRERLRRDPDMRMLFSAAEKATPEHLRAAAAMLKALEPPVFPEEAPEDFAE